MKIGKNPAKQVKIVLEKCSNNRAFSGVEIIILDKLSK